MVSTGNQIPDFLILSPTPYPLRHMLVTFTFVRHNIPLPKLWFVHWLDACCLTYALYWVLLVTTARKLGYTTCGGLSLAIKHLHGLFAFDSCDVCRVSVLAACLNFLKWLPGYRDVCCLTIHQSSLCISLQCQVPAVGVVTTYTQIHS